MTANPEPATSATDIERYIGTRIAVLRGGRSLTQEQLAEAIGVTKGYVSKIENGHIVPPIGTLVKIAHALQVEVTDFLKATGDSHSSRGSMPSRLALVSTPDSATEADSIQSSALQSEKTRPVSSMLRV